MRYYYEDWRGRHYITLKKACPEWINSDCPDILDENESYVMHNGGLNGWYKLPLNDLELLKTLRNFLIKSDIAFCKKYSELGYNPGNIVKHLDKELTPDLLELVI